MVFCFYFTHNSRTKSYFLFEIKEEKQQSQVGIDDSYLFWLLPLLVCRWKGIFNVQIIMIILIKSAQMKHTQSLLFFRCFSSSFYLFGFFPTFFRFFYFLVATCSVYIHSIHIDGSIAHGTFLPVIRFLFAYC